MVGVELPGNIRRSRLSKLPSSTRGVADRQKLVAAFKDVSGGGDLILTAKAGNLARRLGLAPSLKEIEELKIVAGQYCDLSTFATFCKEVAHGNDSAELFAELFACYDRHGSGKVSVRIARNILQNCGEVLTHEEVTSVLADLGTSTDEIDYKAFCARLLSES